MNVADSDNDGLSDFDEVKKYFTNPNNSDSDSDGISDGEEVKQGWNPNKANEKVSVIRQSEDKNFSIKLQNVSGNKLSSFKVEKSNNVSILMNKDAYISGPYNITFGETINGVVISFKFDKSILKDGSKPTIYYFNEEKQELKKLKTSINGDIASATTNHFSEYVLMDEKKLDLKLNNAPKVDGSNVSNSSLGTDEYIVISFPILNLFGVPIYVYDVDGSLVGFENTESTFEGKLKEKTDIKVTVVFKKISKFGANILDKLFSWFENKMTSLYEESTGDSEGIKWFLQYLISYKHIYGGSELEKYFFGEDLGLIENKEEVEKDKDSNKDGISDYFTKLICDGQLTTKYGTNPFGTYLYTEIQKNADFDGDKLKNGEEIEIVEDNGAYYVIEHSSPILADSDEDGVKDKDDASPLKKFDARFSSVKNLSYIPPTPIEDDLENASISVYNSTTGDPGTSLARANIMVSMFGKMPAALALGHFLDNSGETYTFNNDWGLLETYRGKEYLANNTNDLMQVVEETVKSNRTLYFATNQELTGTSFAQHLDDLADIGWWYAVGHTRATMTAKATNVDGDNYKMTLYYNISDFYDWNKDAGIISGFGGLVNDAEMYRLHTYGLAQQYRVSIQYKMEIKWKKGDRYFLNIIKLYETPKTMTIKKLN